MTLHAAPPLIAGLPAEIACVLVGPPLSAGGPQLWIGDCDLEDFERGRRDIG